MVAGLTGGGSRHHALAECLRVVLEGVHGGALARARSATSEELADGDLLVGSGSWFSSARSSASSLLLHLLARRPVQPLAEALPSGPRPERDLGNSAVTFLVDRALYRRAHRGGWRC